MAKAQALEIVEDDTSFVPNRKNNRKLCYMLHLDGLNQAEIAHALGITQQAVSKHLSARRKELEDPVRAQQARDRRPTVIANLIDDLLSVIDFKKLESKPLEAGKLAQALHGIARLDTGESTSNTSVKVSHVFERLMYEDDQAKGMHSISEHTHEDGDGGK